MGVSVEEFWRMTPIEFWDCYIAHYGENQPGEKMTVEKGDKLEQEIRRRLRAKGKTI